MSKRVGGGSQRRRRSGAGNHGRLALLLGLLSVCLVAVVRISEDVSPGKFARHPTPDYIEEERLAQDIHHLLDGAEGTYGVYVKVLETGEKVEIRSGEEFFAASCYKLPLVLMLYEMAQAGEIDLEEKVAYTADDREAGTGIVIGYRYGTQFPLRQLARLAVTKSDNVAANMLLRHLGKGRFIEYQKEAGARVIPESVNISSPADLGLFAERLAQFCAGDPRLGPELLDYFLHSEFRDRIPGLLPGSAKVANKIGTWPGTVNDVGIVMDGEIEYVLVVMSRDVPSIERASVTIAEISREIYNHVMATAR